MSDPTVELGLTIAPYVPLLVGVEPFVPLSVTIEAVAVIDGGAGGDSRYFQNFNSDTVIATHNLNKNPSVTVVDSAGDEVEGHTEYLSLNQVRVTFSSPFIGTLFLN